MYQEKPDHGFDWVMLVCLVLIGVAILVQQVTYLKGFGAMMRFVR